VALVTGGASGLGEAAVRAIVKGGGKAAILDLDERRGAALAVELGKSTAFCKTDISNESDVTSAIDRAAGELGALNVAVNAAGILRAGRVISKKGPFPLDGFELTVRINLVGTFNVIRLASARMAGNTPNADGERGVIINTASIAAYDGQIGQAAYAASKGGVVGMTLPIARDLASYGIRNVTIAPGIFDTPMMGEMPAEVKSALEQTVPFPPRFGRPAEFAALVVHIIENVMINGETIRLDGALRMAPR
jgi:NAD(P)-dependent dehydrogenase (short-subunit alcohol dehydrogenase family)